MKQQNKLKESLLSFLQNLFDLTILNWLWLLCSLPVVTVGPATCGMYAVTLKLARGEAVSPVKDFFRGFRENLKAGVLLGLGAGVLLAAAAGDAWLAQQLTGGMAALFLAAAVIITVLFLILTAYGFALQAMFDNPLKTQLANAFKLAAAVPGRTLLLWLILLIPVLAALALPPVAVGALGFLYIIVGVSGPVFGASHILRDIFDRINGAPVVETMPASEE